MDSSPTSCMMRILFNESVWHMKKWSIQLLVAILALQHAFALANASWQMQFAQKNLPDDITLICSGNAMKWVSISQSDALGEFVFVDPDTFISEDAPQVDCTSKVQADTNSTILFDTVPTITALSAYRSYVQRLYQRPYTSYPYLTVLVRGPPALS